MLIGLIEQPDWRLEAPRRVTLAHQARRPQLDGRTDGIRRMTITTTAPPAQRSHRPC